MEDHRSHHHSHEEIESRPAAAKTQQATPLIGFNKTPAVSRMLSHLGTEPRLPQVLQAIPQRTTAPMNVSELSLFNFAKHESSIRLVIANHYERFSPFLFQ